MHLRYMAIGLLLLSGLLTACPGPGATPGLRLSLEATELSIAQGGSAQVTVNVTRTGSFASPVEVRASGLPEGVSAEPLTIDAGENRGTLTLSASETAAVGPLNVIVTGRSGTLMDTAPLALTITEAPEEGDFSLSLEPTELSIAQGGSAQVTVNVTRTGDFTGEVEVTLVNPPSGISADPLTIAAGEDSGTLTIRANPNAAEGTTNVTVRGTSGNLTDDATLSLTVTQAAVLLVDDDGSINNYHPDDPTVDLSPSDTRFRQALDNLGVGYDVFVVPVNENGPNFDQMQNYETVIWYTGAQSSPLPGNAATISQTDEINLTAYLNLGERKVIAFSPGFLHFYSTNWAEITGNFVNNYIGVTMGRFVFNESNLTVSGVAGTVTEGAELQVAGADAIRGYTSVVEPGEGTDTLFTILFNPENPADPAGNRPVAIATGRHNVGTVGTSTMIFVGFAFENIVDIGDNNRQNVMQSLREY